MATASDAGLNELTAKLQEIRDRVRSRYPQGHAPGLEFPLPNLLPILHARDAAEAKVAAIGSVNPRPPGALNNLIQGVKQQIARTLGWFVRDQVEFNRTAVNAMNATLEALNEVNRSLVSLGNTVAQTRSDADGLRADAAELKDIRAHWLQWREGWERRLHLNEAHYLRSIAEMNAAIERRLATVDINFRESLRAQHAEYVAALDQATKDIQKQLWADLDHVRTEYERLIHYELRLIRQSRTATVVTSSSAPAAAAPQDFTEFDYLKFAEKFRGSEKYVREGQRFYVPYFEKCANVLDIGCGRGEFLEVMREHGIPAQGIDLDSASVAMCREKGLQADVANLFEFLADETGTPFDGIFAGQIVEHLPPDQLPRMIKLCAARLKPGGVCVIETPNPECLAIFATHFFIDPTHTRPVPPALLSFYFEEFGLGRIEIHRRFPARDSMPEIASLPEAVQQKFFGGLDYAVIGRKL